MGASSSLELPMVAAKLLVMKVNPTWWEWNLVTKGATIVLGAEVLQDLIPRALSHLSEGAPPSCKIDGRSAAHVFSLSEKHHSLYAAKDGSDRILYFQNANAEIIWLDRLAAEHLLRWKAVMDAALDAS